MRNLVGRLIVGAAIGAVATCAIIYVGVYVLAFLSVTSNP
jgi:hypothetical protein